MTEIITPVRPESSWASRFSSQDIEDARFICERRSHAHGEINLWRENSGVVPQEVKDEFEAKLAAAVSMQEKLDVFLNPDLLPYLNSYDLGESANPSNPSDLKKVEASYHDVLDTLIHERGWVDREMTREESGRTTIKEFKLDGATVFTRNRKLFTFSFPRDAEDGAGIPISVRKQTTFLAHDDLIRAIRSQVERNIYETKDGEEILAVKSEVQAIIENAIDLHVRSVFPIRTAFIVVAN